MLELNKVYCMDCLDFLKQIDDKGIDLIVIDPPYNIGKDDWDKIDNYESWLKLVILELQRVLKDNGAFYIFHSDIQVIMDFALWFRKDTKFIFKQLIIWNKISTDFRNHGFVQQRLSIDMMRNYYSGFTEYILYYTFQDQTGLEHINENYIKPRNPMALYLDSEIKRSGKSRLKIAGLFPSKTGGLTGCVSNWVNGDNFPLEEQYNKIRDFLGEGFLTREYEELRKEYEELRKEYEELRYVYNVQIVKQDLRANTNVWLYPPAKADNHITPKPLELIKNIIFHSSNEGQIVLDCFMGSGTTALACQQLGRNFIGCDNKEEYCKIANERLNQKTLNSMGVLEKKQEKEVKQ